MAIDIARFKSLIPRTVKAASRGRHFVKNIGPNFFLSHFHTDAWAGEWLITPRYAREA